MANERDTEDIVRDHFKSEVRTSGGRLILEEQRSLAPEFARALKNASKSGGMGAGSPEFFVYEGDDHSFVVVVECKAEVKLHESPRSRRGEPSTPSDVVKYAVDGARHYAAALARVTNVVAIAVSGDGKGLRVSTFRQMRGEAAPAPLLDRDGQPVGTLRLFGQYREYFHHDPSVEARSTDEVTAFSRVIHNFMRDYAKLTEEQKPLIVSAILLAFQNSTFRAGWEATPLDSLPDFLYNSVDRKVKDAGMEADRRELMMSAYAFIKTHPELARATTIKLKGDPEVKTSPLQYLVSRIEAEVLHFTDTYAQVDLVGQFYAEFLRYTGGDGKGLGIVLTPRHLTELFVKLAKIGVDDTVIDPCAGTGGFLISAMAEMDRLAKDDEKKLKSIRSRQLIGIEQQAHMFALGASNMILRGDGRSNLYRGSIFDETTTSKAGRKNKHHARPTKGLINPPFSQKGELQHELDFVKAMLDMLEPRGLGVAVVPMSCAIAPDPARERILADHTLVAAMSLPHELFAPVGTITCALVFRAHEPHAHADEPTWFGHWVDDGFVKTKNRGRRDLDGRWAGIRDQWLADYNSRTVAAGRGVSRKVTADDEWCVEAYMETDYSRLTPADFEKVLREYAVFTLTSEADDADD